jgi:hypothetical protein
MSKDGERVCWKHALRVMAVPIDSITENTVMNDSRLTNHSGMISTKSFSPFAAVLLCPDLAQIGVSIAPMADQRQ